MYVGTHGMVHAANSLKITCKCKNSAVPYCPYLPCNYPVCAAAASALRSSRVHNKTATENEFGVCGTKR